MPDTIDQYLHFIFLFYLFNNLFSVVYLNDKLKPVTLRLLILYLIINSFTSVMIYLLAIYPCQSQSSFLRLQIYGIAAACAITAWAWITLLRKQSFTILPGLIICIICAGLFAHAAYGVITRNIELIQMIKP